MSGRAASPVRLRPLVVALLCVAAASLSAAAEAARAQQPQTRLLTIAARSCPSYTDITANRARNNIMESLEDLGVDTPYGTGGRPVLVDAATEAAVQPNCTPIDNWQFTLGTGYRSRAVSGVWGSLSIVTGPFAPTLATEASVPLRDGNGTPVPGATIAGATTIALTPEQANLSQQGNRLWIQGGTPTVPITDSETYGFGALRCATDNLNGDNVEWISYPPNTVHVFCFAYYVKPAPTSGTITVVKEVALPPGTAPQRLRFTGDISYANNEFFLTAANGAPGRTSFIRAAGRTWTFREIVGSPVGRLTAITCTSTRPGASSWTTDLQSAETAVTLGPGDTVTCVYRNVYRRPASGLVLRKITLGGVGTFGFAAGGEDATAAGEATTISPGVAAVVEPTADFADLPAGSYSITETGPPDRGGTWSFERVACQPPPLLRRPLGLVTIDVPVTAGAVCTFTNRFTPAGRITLRKVTLGGTATTRFQVRAASGDDRPELDQLATTTTPGEEVVATGEALTELPIGRYGIKETIGGPNRWRLASVVCDGVAVPSVTGQIAITLTEDDPEKDCTFANEQISDVVPPDPPPPPAPEPPPEPPVEVPDSGGSAGTGDVSPVSELAVTKRVQPGRVRVGGRLRFRIVVANRGPDPAEDVTLAEPGATPRGGALALRSSRGSCRTRPPRFCRLGTLAPGEQATIRATVRTARPGRYVNTVAVNAATTQQSTRNKRARSRFRVLAPRLPRYTG